jgi:hypothetical protein
MDKQATSVSNRWQIKPAFGNFMHCIMEFSQLDHNQIYASIIQITATNLSETHFNTIFHYVIHLMLMIRDFLDVMRCFWVNGSHCLKGT